MCVAGACVCKPKTCDDLGKTCGTFDDGCGNPLDCGTCPELKECVDGNCKCVAEYSMSGGGACNATFCINMEIDESGLQGRFILYKTSGVFSGSDMSIQIVSATAGNKLLWETGCGQLGVAWELVVNKKVARTTWLTLADFFPSTGCQDVFIKLNAPCGSTSFYSTPTMKVCHCL